MSAWSKQAVPLIFAETAAVAILAANSTSQRVRSIDARVQKWLQACWDALGSNRHNPADDKAMRKAVGSAQRIKDALMQEWSAGIQTNSEVTVALCIIAEDTIESMPAKHPGRRAWNYLLKALYDMLQLSDPHETDTHGYERGKRIAARVLEAAQ